MAVPAAACPPFTADRGPSSLTNLADTSIPPPSTIWWASTFKQLAQGHNQTIGGLEHAFIQIVNLHVQL